MNQSLIVKPSLDKANRDLGDATRHLRHIFDRDGDDTMHTALSVEALGRAIASVSYAVERLAELVVDD